MSAPTVDIHAVVDYIIVKLDEGEVSLNVLKLQKLLFYVQAWHLAFNDAPFFRGKFQAWIHGPVNRQIYDRFKDTHSLYATVRRSDVPDANAAELLSERACAHIDEVLEAYGDLSGTQLEAMTHSEQPWLAARAGLRWSERGERVIDENLMADFYRKQLDEVE
ncbi:type II toxin-antitoxin system antitoxin SocA domain-containing protein [Burkholderia sp. Ax-1724]|uniref:Panacea domain-containing protein n=1 Tax=Burkholderia sp. Ax-1724 TaxID=2608336 RepID=UPI001423AB41|nr:type II toxin-antitoxin system antitoxin SocA domain-containing protein [Burkholderia sp. Ax-1724]NIF52598.1 DUF4065 domain-containing protein [Burkholderia sp. Ax-1724]